jgi:large conductance mechanosensitive channel
VLQEFKKFALRGNVLDLAIGVIIGGAFGKIVNSLVEDIIMPPIGVLLSVSHVQNFADWFIPLVPLTKEQREQIVSVAEAKKAAIPTINYGLFVNNVLTFLIVAFAIFILVRQVNRLAPPVVKTRECPQCCSSISAKAKRCPNCTSEVVPLIA